MAVLPSAELLNLIFNGGKKHKDYDDSVKICKSLRRHVNKEDMDDLITTRRPSEDDESLKYRKDIWQPVTSIPPLQVIAALGKIRRSSDWNVEFPVNEDASIIETETLEYYCNESFPIYGSLEQWIFTEYLYTMCVDPNAYIVTLPVNFEGRKTSEYYRPAPIIVNSDRVLYPPEKGDYFIFKSTDKVDLQTDAGVWQVNQGNVFYVINQEVVVRWEQVDFSGNYRPIEYKNSTGKIPVFKVRALFKEQRDRYTLQVSRLDPMVPELNEAAREYSDLQIVKAKTAYPIPWRWKDDPCPACNGLGTISNPASTLELPLPRLVCSTCHGKGETINSPFAEIIIRKPAPGEEMPPTPAAGFVERDVNSMKALQESYDGHISRSLESVHMQSINNIQLATSGESKRMDNEPTQNFVYGVAEDAVWGYQQQCYWDVEWRYSIRVLDEAKRKKMVPNIPVPEDFDMLPVDYVLGQIATAKTAKLNPALIATMESNAASKLYYNKPKLAKIIGAIFALNPLSGYSEDEKSTMLMNKQVTLKDCVISSYVELFVQQAMEEDKQFLTKPWTDQMKVMEQKAQKKMDENSAAEQIKSDLNNDPNNVPGGELKAVPANQVAA